MHGQRSQRTASDRSALDRTFAAWVRSGMALAALGFIVLRLGYYLEELARAAGTDVPFYRALTTPVGLLHLFAGALIILLAGLWHRDSARRLAADAADPRGLAPAVVMAVTAASVAGGVGLAIDLVLAAPR
jgi:putative membrane protein